MKGIHSRPKHIYVQNYIVNIHRMLRKLINLKLIWCSLVSSSVYSLFNRNLHGVDTNGLVQRAINASNVYENIAGYIEEANKAALLALNTTNRVNDVSSCHNTGIYLQCYRGFEHLSMKKKQDLASLSTSKFSLHILLHMLFPELNPRWSTILPVYIPL